jgi:hypothetical protein
MQADAVSVSQTGALLGYGKQIFGLADISTDDNLTKISIRSGFITPSGKVFEVWMVDGNYRASGYPLSLDQISPTGTLKYIEVWFTPPPIQNLVVTLEPENDKDPKPNWSQAVAAYWLAPPLDNR